MIIIATKRHIRIYDLLQQKLLKKLLCPAQWIASMDIHINGNHIICGSYDRRLCWFDLDLSDKPYKTLKYHKKL